MVHVVCFLAFAPCLNIIGTYSHQIVTIFPGDVRHLPAYITGTMTTHSETRPMPYSAKQIYDLVADIGSYPKFLPWVAGARITGVRANKAAKIVDADLIVSFKLFRETFGSCVTLNPDALAIDVEYIDGPFKYLNNHWRFEDTATGCNVIFHVDFEFKSRLLQATIGVVFNEAMQRIVRAFEERADALYGPAAKAV